MNQRKKNGLFSLKELDIIAAFLPQGLLKQITTGMGIYISTIRDNVKYDAIITTGPDPSPKKACLDGYSAVLKPSSLQATFAACSDQLLSQIVPHWPLW